jgi:TRAP-type mannitol/chloroaromatic compound transport system substrate-binding protein
MHFANSKSVLFAAAAAVSIAIAGPAQAAKIKLDMQGGYGGNVGLLGPAQLHLVETVNKVSGGSIEMRFHEPNTFVPNLQSLDAVGNGSLDAAWTSPGYWKGKDGAFNLIGAVPFGPGAGEYIAWIKFGGGRELWDELYAQYNVIAIPCGIIPPEGSGWFRNEITTVDQLKGLKMRFYGLGAKVMEKLGVSTQLIGGGEIFQALQLGTIDATEFSMPVMDLSYGFYQVTPHYYFPGWHQQSTLNDLLISKDKWNEMDETQHAVIETSCDANMMWEFANGEALQGPALKELKEKGVQIHMWSPEILDAMRAQWDVVIEEEKAASPMFTKMWDSLSKFRGDYKTWKEVGYLP